MLILTASTSTIWSHTKMLVLDYRTEEIWFAPWSKKADSIWITAFLLSDGRSVAIKHKLYEKPNYAKLLEGLDVIESSEKILISPTSGKVAIYKIYISSSIHGDPYIKLEKENVSTKDKIEEAHWMISHEGRQLWGRITDKISEFKYRDILKEFLDFREIVPEYYEEKLYVTECPACFRQILLEQNKHIPDPDDPYDSNLIVWLEGQYMPTHDHPIDMDDARNSAWDILMEHLESGNCGSEIQMDKRYMGYQIPDEEWQFTAKRDSEGKLEAKCKLCPSWIHLTQDNTLRKAADWFANHVCPNSSSDERKPNRKDFHVV